MFTPFEIPFNIPWFIYRYMPITLLYSQMNFIMDGAPAEG